MSLLDEHKTVTMPNLEDKIVQRFSNNNTRKVVIAKQEDRYDLQMVSIDLSEMKNIFHNKDWTIFNQLSQFPVTQLIMPECLT